MEVLVQAPDDRPRPDQFHARTGHALPKEKSQVFQQLNQLSEYAKDNEMEINFSKTKCMVFNAGKAMDCMPSLNIEDNEIEVVQSLKVLGLVIREDMKWSSNTDHIIIKAFKKIWILRRLKVLGANVPDLMDINITHVRCMLELAVPAWHPGLTAGEAVDIERVQRAACQIILGMSYTTYSDALDFLKLETLESRRVTLCMKFGIKALKHPKHKQWFQPNLKKTNTRQQQPKYCQVIAKTRRFENSPISYLTNLLNKYTKLTK